MFTLFARGPSLKVYWFNARIKVLTPIISTLVLFPKAIPAAHTSYLPRQAYREFHLGSTHATRPIVSHNSSLVTADRDLRSQRLSLDCILYV